MKRIINNPVLDDLLDRWSGLFMGNIVLVATMSDVGATLIQAKLSERRADIKQENMSSDLVDFYQEKGYPVDCPGDEVTYEMVLDLSIQNDEEECKLKKTLGKLEEKKSKVGAYLQDLLSDVDQNAVRIKQTRDAIDNLMSQIVDIREKSKTTRY